MFSADLRYDETDLNRLGISTMSMLSILIEEYSYGKLYHFVFVKSLFIF